MATNDKNDRQLRLWGANGQKALMEAHILLINADAVGTETLKNLVLPGIGKFTVLDNQLVDHDDIGNNFFVSSTDFGRPRAEVVTELLCEMNPDVSGIAISQVAIPSIGLDFLTQFSLIIASNLTENEFMSIANSCNDKNIPLLMVRSYGFIGYCRIQIKQHSIIESKPDSDQFDLRITNPFNELKSYCTNFNLTEMESTEHSHTPFVVILYQAIEQWKSIHNGNLPSTFVEKESFKGVVKAMSRDYSKEQNFEEAIKESYRVFTKKTLPEEVLELLEKQDGVVLSAESSEFE